RLGVAAIRRERVRSGHPDFRAGDVGVAVVLAAGGRAPRIRVCAEERFYKERAAAIGDGRYCRQLPETLARRAVRRSAPCRAACRLTYGVLTLSALPAPVAGSHRHSVPTG